MKNKPTFIQNFRWKVFLLIGLLLFSTTYASAQSISYGKPAQPDIQKLAVVVKVDEDFSTKMPREVFFEEEEGGGPGPGFLIAIPSIEAALLGAVIIFPLLFLFDAIHDHKEEKRYQKRVEEFPQLSSQLNPMLLIGKRVKQRLIETGSFAEVGVTEIEDKEALKAEGFDGALEITLKEWDFIKCPAIKDKDFGIEPMQSKGVRSFLYDEKNYLQHNKEVVKAEERMRQARRERLENNARMDSSTKKYIRYDRRGPVRLVSKIHGKLYSLQDGSPAWSREELYQATECYNVAFFRLNETLILVLKESIISIADDFAKSVSYP